MTNRKIPLSYAAALLMIPLASALSADPIKCGHGVTCDWIEDIPTRGAFVLSHGGAVGASEDPLKDQPHSFVSPSGFWTVAFDFFHQYAAPDGLIPAAGQVNVDGYMQHLTRPPGPEHATDPAMGDKFPFKLEIVEFVQPEDSASGKENHGHNDTYFALLSGTDAPPPKTGILAYNFGVKGQHTEIQFTPAVPEPSTFLLVGTVVLLPLLKKVGQAFRRGTLPCPSRPARHRG
jgi:hypothetical protein